VNMNLHIQPVLPDTLYATGWYQYQFDLVKRGDKIEVLNSRL
jgi:hypothetical protein